MTKINLFDPYSVDENKLLLASHLPIGRVWQKGFSPDSNVGKFLHGLAAEFYRFQVLCSDIVKEMDINTANDLLIEWERSVGIPDNCFLRQGYKTIEERRFEVEQKFSKFGGVQTADDFVRVAAAFGITVEVYYGAIGGGLGFPWTFPTIFTSLYADYTEASHTIIVLITGTYTTSDTFALPFPIPFSTGPVSFLQCIFRKLAPANVEVVVIYEETP